MKCLLANYHGGVHIRTLATPIGLVMRVCGRDVMQLKADPENNHIVSRVSADQKKHWKDHSEMIYLIKDLWLFMCERTEHPLPTNNKANNVKDRFETE